MLPDLFIAALSGFLSGALMMLLCVKYDILFKDDRR